MLLEVFEKLEVKVQQTVDTIALLQVEIEALKERNQSLLREISNTNACYEEAVKENQKLKEQQQMWQNRLQTLLARIENT